MLDLLESLVWHRVNNLETILKNGETLHFFLMTQYNRADNAKTYMFALSGKTGKPLFYIKVAKRETGNAYLMNSHSNLIRLQKDERLREIQDSFPRPIFVEELMGHYIQVESFVPGHNLEFLTLTNRDHKKYLLKAADWILDFHNRTKKYVDIDQKLIHETFLPYIDRALQKFPHIGWLNECVESQRRLNELLGTRLPLVFSHNCFSVRNVKVDQGAIRVIDWENAHPEGLPLIDLVHLFMSYYMNVYHEPYDKAFIRLLDINNELFSGIFSRYLSVLNISRKVITFLLFYYFILRAITVISYRDEALTCLRRLESGDYKYWISHL